ncbi:MAG: superoxide dismutase [Ni] [Phycisphaerae bacterium]|jgi:nickel superoxide dismutase
MKKIKRQYVFAIAVSAAALFCLSSVVFSHCEIPCGIYNDAMRLDMMAEHITTIEKSMNQINELSKDADKNYNQIVRWVVNKEEHANYLSDIVTQYFMNQRVTPVDDGGGQAYQDYVHKLTILHKLMVYSMKCKQTTDLSNIAKMRECLGQFKSAYSGAGGSTSEKSHEAEHKHSMADK